MVELDPRPPHVRHYTAPDGRVADMPTNDRGIVEITEELLHDLFTQAGYTENTEPTT